jgi:Protein of unknown function (DUF4254)
MEGAMTLPSSDRIIAFHDGSIIHADWGAVQQGHADGVWVPIVVNHRYNYLLWKEEDHARRRDVADGDIVANKRAIDRYNQIRNDAVEHIDERLLAVLANIERAPTARLNSEAAGSMIDRLSILSLKIYHMQLQTEREDTSEAHRETCAHKLSLLRDQRNNLMRCLDELWNEALAGRAYFKVYRQFKMYNDPTLNPYLYGRQ